MNNPNIDNLKFIVVYQEDNGEADLIMDAIAAFPTFMAARAHCDNVIRWTKDKNHRVVRLPN